MSGPARYICRIYNAFTSVCHLMLATRSGNLGYPISVPVGDLQYGGQKALVLLAVHDGRSQGDGQQLIFKLKIKNVLNNFKSKQLIIIL